MCCGFSHTLFTVLSEFIQKILKRGAKGVFEFQVFLGGLRYIRHLSICIYFREVTLDCILLDLLKRILIKVFSKANV